MDTLCYKRKEKKCQRNVETLQTQIGLKRMAEMEMAAKIGKLPNHKDKAKQSARQNGVEVLRPRDVRGRRCGLKLTSWPQKLIL